MFEIEPGRVHPLGAISDANGVNFSLFSEHATYVELLLFAEHNVSQLLQIIPLDPLQHRTFHFWHVYVKNMRPGIHYAFRVDGPQDLHDQGHRFNRNKVLIDPYARGNAIILWNRSDAAGPGDNLQTSMRSTVIDTTDYDWEGDQPLHRPMNETIIYEMHIGGFTRSPSSRCLHPGTFAAVVEKIPYLKELGITAVELQPVFTFDPADVSLSNPLTGELLSDYWGYNPISHFSPHSAYCLSPEEGSHIPDFRDMVKALHKAGIEVILDVVFNHTGEGNQFGPTISLRGLDNSIYYYLDPRDKQYYRDYSGCGNTLSCNHPIVEKLIADCLEFWVKEMHVDGFRFDEGTILARGEDGAPLKYPPVIWHIALDESLADTKVIAEAWDAGGLYAVGSFPGERWAEWNGHYRDDMRRFVKGDTGMIGSVATRLAGSSDLYELDGRMPTNSINFITCHDGFTMNDLVSYNNKHNEANAENNRDGIDNNESWNCGIEGASDDPLIEALRERQIKNFASVLLLSQGVPMLLSGDEIRRTQQGNNNAYCQDNAISWFDWELLNRNSGLFRFFKLLIGFRKRHGNLRREHFLTGMTDAQGQRDIDWHGCKLFSPSWNDPNSRVLAFTLWGLSQDDTIHVMLNMDVNALNFELLPLSGGKEWLRVVDTSQASPMDIVEPGSEIAVSGGMFKVESHSVVVLISPK